MKHWKYIIVILSVLVIGLLGYTIYLRSEIKTLENKNNTDSGKKETNNNENIDEVKKEYEYDCSFTKTYHLVNLLDGYVAEIPELSYVVVDSYLTHNALSINFPSRLKKGMEVGKWYDFTYTIKGVGNITDMNDLYSELSSTELYNYADGYAKDKEKKLFVTLSVKETDRRGMNTLNEDICIPKN